MPTKPSTYEINAYQTMRSNPNFAKDAMEAIINETPQLAQALLDAGLVEEVKN